MLTNNLLPYYGEDYLNIMYTMTNDALPKREASFNTYLKLIEEVAKNIEEEDERLKFRGDTLEIFAEIFFNAFENDPSVGLSDYELVDIENDYGVDGLGTNPDGRRIAVQVKYRSNPFNPVLYSEIANTFTSGMITYGLDLLHKQSVYVFTTAVDCTAACQKVLGNRLVMINRDIINEKIENNESFWNFAFKEVFEYLNQ